MPRMPRVAAREVVAALKRGGWYVDDVRGSHHQLLHPDRPGKVTVPVHGSRVLEPWVLKSVLNQARMTVDEFRDLL